MVGPSKPKRIAYTLEELAREDGWGPSLVPLVAAFTRSHAVSVLRKLQDRCEVRLLAGEGSCVMDEIDTAITEEQK